MSDIDPQTQAFVAASETAAVNDELLTLVENDVQEGIRYRLPFGFARTIIKFK